VITLKGQEHESPLKQDSQFQLSIPNSLTIEDRFKKNEGKLKMNLVFFQKNKNCLYFFEERYACLQSFI